MEQSSLSADVQRLLDIEAIKQLKFEYGYTMDGERWDDLMALFTEDAVADFGPFGRFEGKTYVERFFRQFVAKQWPFLVHTITNPVIDVQGDRATGKWYFLVPAIYKGPTDEGQFEDAVWAQGRYEEEYVKVDGKWKIRNMKAIFNYATPYREGWFKKRFISAKAQHL